MSPCCGIWGLERQKVSRRYSPYGWLTKCTGKVAILLGNVLKENINEYLMWETEAGVESSLQWNELFISKAK